MTTFRIAGKVVVDARSRDRWSFDEDHRIAKAIREIVYAPAGADVEIVVAARQHPSFALDYLRDHAGHLGSVTIVAPDGETIGRWVRALRDGAAVTTR